MDLKHVLYYAAEGSLSDFESNVKKAEKEGKNWLNEKDEKGRNVLFYAAMTDSIKNFLYIIKRASLRAESLLQIVDNTNATVLHWATQYSSIRVVKEIIAMFFENRPAQIILAKDADSVTSLHIAATKQNTKILRLFIDNLTCDDNVYQIAQDKKLRSPLHHAACHVNIDAIRMMIDDDIDRSHAPVLGFPIDQRDRTGIIPLMCAVGVRLPQALPVIKFLAKKKPVSKTRQNKDGMTVLHIAVASRNLPAVQLLVEELDCSVDLVDNEQRTPLHYAAEHAYPEIVQYLITHGARNSTVDKIGVTPAHYAAQFSVDCLRIILTETGINEVKDNEGRSCLMWAVCAGNVDVINFLIKREDAPDRRAVDKHGYTALHLAAMVGNVNVCRTLIRNGWSHEERDNKNNTVLHLAAGRGHTDVLRCLVTAGATINHTDTMNRTAVFWACLGGQAHTLHCMIKELSFEWRTSGGSEIKPKTDAFERTPLHASAIAGSSACINVLLMIERENNFLSSPLVGYRDLEGKTALHDACIIGKIDCVLSLLKGGSAINAMDYEKRTPLDFAIEFKHELIIDHLKVLQALTYHDLAESAATVIQRRFRAYREKKIEKLQD